MPSDAASSRGLSLSLPLGEEPFGDVPVRAWFGNLLHENDQLEATMARYGIERSDIAGLLDDQQALIATALGPDLATRLHDGRLDLRGLRGWSRARRHALLR